MEKIITFGKDDSMMGILTEAQGSSASSGKPLVMILNAGIVHRVGPYRSSVDIARRLAAMGFSVFRFDLSGLGDSEMRRDNRTDEERAVVDVQETMDHLGTRLGVSRFILMGLCSGADNAHPVSVRDPRVVGGVFLDGFGYETTGFYLHHYLDRLKDPTRWRNVFNRLWSGIARGLLFWRRSNADVAQQKTKTYVREFPPRDKTEREVQLLIDRGMELLYIYTSGVARYLNHKGQFRAMFPKLRWGKNIQLEFYPRADHTYSVLSDRDWLYETVQGWMKRFG
jgi:pimeloyl-ACP methyl ester carboxylesterase